MIVVTGISKPLIEGWLHQTEVLVSNAAPNNHNAGELLILAFIGSRFGHNVSGDCTYIRQPVIA